MNRKTSVTKPDMLMNLNESSNMAAKDMDIFDMTVAQINAETDKRRRRYVLRIREIYSDLGLEYDPGVYRKYKEMAQKDASTISIQYVDEFGNDVQLFPFDKITWLDAEKALDVNASESFIEIMNDPRQAKSKYLLIDFMALKSKYSKKTFRALMVRYTKSNNGKRHILFKHEGTLNGNSYLDIWPIKKTRTSFRLKEKSYTAGQIKELFNHVCKEISENTEYLAKVEYNYFKNKKIKNAQEELTHICWRLCKKTEIIEQSTDRQLQYVEEIKTYGYEESEAISISKALVEHEEPIEQFRNLHEYVLEHEQDIPNKIGYIIAGIKNHYKIKADSKQKKKSQQSPINTNFNNFDQRSYTPEQYANLENKMSK